MDKRPGPGRKVTPNHRPAAGKPPARKPAAASSVLEKPFLLAAVVLALTLVVFLPVFSSDFLTTWDDSEYILKNQVIRSLGWDNIKAMFSTQIGGTYVPLPLLSYAVEYRLFGLSSPAFHLTNLLIHLFSTLFVLLILRRLGLKSLFAATGALLFGIHPMGVESVAWVTERKDLLYAFFYLAAVIAYLDYVQKKPRSYLYLGLSWGLFLLALLSKIQAVSLPLILLAIDLYRKRTGWIRLVLEKVPFFVLSLLFGVAGIFILKNMGALRVNEMYTLPERIFFGSYAFSAYLVKFVAPWFLSALYPYPVRSGTALPFLYYLSPLMFAVLAFAAWKSRKKYPEVTFGILFFTLSVFFVLQIFGAGQGFMADRYTRIPYVGLIFIVSWAMQHYLEKNRSRKPLVMVLLGLALVAFMVLAYRRTGVWKNGETLWTDVIGKYPGKDSRPYACRGLYYKEIDEPDKALKDFTSTLAIDPGDVEILQFRGNLYFARGRDDSAYADYIRAIRIKQDNALALANLGAIYVRRNQFDSALINLSKALELDTTQVTAYANRAVVYSATNRGDEAIADFKRYLVSNPNDERVCFSIGMIFYNRGQVQESIPWFNRAIDIKPGFANYHWMRSQAMRQAGNRDQALKDALLAQELGMQVSPDYLRTLK